ncbi:unnamed protein product [Cyclocybe aegerita]|uniref:Fido domain-containing protein n=1 Tax=Cyclocybe aegerita TaxID=1973307 RepID=A0A8S0W327_CYCAE|nr:unnamed protein product [Cyclocybe aegerita]
MVSIERFRVQRSFKPGEISKIDSLCHQLQGDCQHNQLAQQERWNAGKIWLGWKSAGDSTLPSEKTEYTSLRDWWRQTTQDQERLKRTFRAFILYTHRSDGVYRLHPQTIVDAIRLGPVAATFRRINPNGQVSFPQTIELIYRNAIAAFQMVCDQAKSGKALTRDCLCEVHRVATKTKHSIQTPRRDRLPCPNFWVSFYPSGVTRTQSERNLYQMTELGKIQYCPFQDVDNELDCILKKFNESLNSDPLLVAAWMYTQMMSIAPFEGANEEIARFVASVPLLRVGLPPFIVCDDSQMDAAIDASRVSGDCRPVKDILLNGLQHACEMIDHLAPVFSLPGDSEIVFANAGTVSAEDIVPGALDIEL